MLRRPQMQRVPLVVLFAFCQIIGFMCIAPNAFEAKDAALSQGESMTCLMDGAFMCSPIATSSPERKVKHSEAVAIDRGPVVFGLDKIQIMPEVLAQWLWSSDGSIVPIPISSPLVLRI